MKVSALFKIIVKEFKKDIFISILLFALVDFIYANFTGMSLDRANGMILWQGGNDNNPLSLSTILLKLLNISIVFMTAGKIADKLSADIMISILARITDYRKFIYAYSIVVILLGEMLLAASHLVYYCFAKVYPEQIIPSFLYFFLDTLGFLGMMILYMILEHCCSLDNSFACIIAIYGLNTALPLPVPLAMSTVRFSALTSRISIDLLLLLLVGMDLIVAVLYYMLIRRKRVNLC